MHFWNRASGVDAPPGKRQLIPTTATGMWAGPAPVKQPKGGQLGVRARRAELFSDPGPEAEPWRPEAVAMEKRESLETILLMDLRPPSSSMRRASLRTVGCWKRSVGVRAHPNLELISFTALATMSECPPRSKKLLSKLLASTLPCGNTASHASSTCCSVSVSLPNGTARLADVAGTEIFCGSGSFFMSIFPVSPSGNSFSATNAVGISNAATLSCKKVRRAAVSMAQLAAVSLGT
mmetsp:Transcript_44981/g.75051  ORF Transcript_44981/g.75051 Transcript_44981/m.75051 type:complete len:236 (-) Transcript_44981:249-956(-)